MPTSPAFFPDDFPGEITLDHVIPGAAAEFAPLPQDMRPELAAALAARGIVSLYTHQADAYRAVRNGRHLVVVTPTASGKTLCYNLPVLQRLLENPERRALYLYPTKALAQDQLAELSASKLLEEENIELIERSGAPRGERRLIFYNPPLISREMGIRRSSMLEARRIAAPWIRSGVQTILFCRSRLQVEVMLSYLRQDLAPRLDASRRVRGYRAGYLPLHRREIEAGLRDGEITAVVSTNALELGIDIGTLQAAVMVGYPGTIASTWQQLGRAGRRSGSIAVFVASSSPLDQFIVRHPEYFLGASPEEGLIDPDNLLVLAGHLQAGLFELPFLDEERLGRAEVGQLLRLFEEDGSATRSAGRWFWSRQAFPAEEVHLRRIAADNVVIIDTSQPRPSVIGEMDQFSAPVLLHEEAVYLHEGAQFHVDRLDWDERSEEHTSELQSQFHLVCRLLLE